MIFVREVRSRVTQEFPDMNALDVMKEVGRRWQSITDEDKNYYQALADKDKERFKRENQQYMKELEQLDSRLKSSASHDLAGDGDKGQQPSGQLGSGLADGDPKALITANGKIVNDVCSRP